MSNPYIINVLDTETTGLLVPSANDLKAQPYIAELYVAKLALEDDKIEFIGELNHLIKPPVPISEEITKITGITQAMVDDKPTFEDLQPKISQFFTGVHCMVAHNLPFDRAMMANELLRCGKLLNFPWPTRHICTVEAAMPIEQRRINLGRLHELATGKPHEGAHRAKEDVHALVRGFNYLLEKGLIEI